MFGEDRVPRERSMADLPYGNRVSDPTVFESGSGGFNNPRRNPCVTQNAGEPKPPAQLLVVNGLPYAVPTTLDARRHCALVVRRCSTTRDRLTGGPLLAFTPV